MPSVLRHQEVLNVPCLPPWLLIAAQLHPRCIKYPKTELCDWSADAQQAFAGHAATHSDSCIWSAAQPAVLGKWLKSDIPPEKRMYTRTPGTQMQPLPRGDWASDLQSHLSQHKWISLNPNHSYRIALVAAQHTPSRYFCWRVSFVSVLKNRCHIQNMSIFVCFSKCWWE